MTKTVLPPVLRDTDYSILDRLLMDTVLAGEIKELQVPIDNNWIENRMGSLAGQWRGEKKGK